MISPAITAIVIAVLVALSFGGGFALGGSVSIHQMKLANDKNFKLLAANKQCAADIHITRMMLEALLVAKK